MGVRTLIIPLFLVLFCCVFGCKNTRPNPVSENAYDLPQIKDSGELVVLTLYSSTSGNGISIRSSRSVCQKSGIKT